MKNALKKLWKMIGPGVITGAADDDPAGIATYSQAGATFGFRMLYMAPLSYPLMSVIQETCARIALATGKGLAENIRTVFGKRWLWFVAIPVVLANTFTIGADLAGMADAARLLVPGVDYVAVLIFITFASAMLEVFVPYSTYARYLKWLAFSLLAYIVTGLMLHFDLTALLSATFIPKIGFDGEEIIMIAAILGTTISPYLFFWQSSEEVEEEIEKGNTTIESRVEDGPKEIKRMRWDVWMGMLFSNLIMYFVIAVSGATLFESGQVIDSAADAAVALEPLAGDFASLIFALGILGTGFLAIPVLAGSSAYIIAEAAGFKEGLYNKPKEAKAFYAVIVLSMFIGMFATTFGFSPMKALLYSSVVNALVAPIALVFIFLISGSEKHMNGLQNGRWTRVIGWGTTVLMVVVGVLTVKAVFF